MAKVLAALISGLIFGLGLQISGMTDPIIVLGFLDIFGEWNPRLAVMMGSAVAVTFIGYRIAGSRGQPLFATETVWPTKTAIDRPLVGGALLFGLGWGLVGLCPGPAIVNLATLSPRAIGFVAAMVVGMIALDGWLNRRRGNESGPERAARTLAG
jgi:uncharacterized membrane protein YedE/YeeE